MYLSTNASSLFLSNRYGSVWWIFVLFARHAGSLQCPKQTILRQAFWSALKKFARSCSDLTCVPANCMRVLMFNFLVCSLILLEMLNFSSIFAFWSASNVSEMIFFLLPSLFCRLFRFCRPPPRCWCWGWYWCLLVAVKWLWCCRLLPQR